MMRLAHTQVCPAFLYLEVIAPFTAASISASSKTINGALPPSSIETFFTVVAHCANNNLPISVDPVKLSFLTIELDESSPPMAVAEPVTQEKTPGGMPASSANWHSARALNGV